MKKSLLKCVHTTISSLNFIPLMILTTGVSEVASDIQLAITLLMIKPLYYVLLYSAYVGCIHPAWDVWMYIYYHSVLLVTTAYFL